MLLYSVVLWLERFLLLGAVIFLGFVTDHGISKFQGCGRNSSVNRVAVRFRSWNLHPFQQFSVWSGTRQWPVFSGPGFAMIGTGNLLFSARL